MSLQTPAADLKAEFKRLVETEIEKLSTTIDSEIEKLVINLNEKFERRINEIDNIGKIKIEPKTIGKEESKDSDKDEKQSAVSFGDLDKKYEEALDRSGGEEALKEFRMASDTLHKKVVSKIVETEIEKLLPAAMRWNGSSKYLVNQPYVRTIDELYEKAGEAHGYFKRAVEEIASQIPSKPTVNVTNLKGKERAMEKAKFKYVDEDKKGVAYYRLTDIVRGALVFDDIAKMYNGLKEVESCSHFEIIEFNDRFQAPNPNSGSYRDMQLTVRLKEGGFLCELQLSTKRMTRVKEMYGHRNYEVYRRLEAAVQDRDLDQIEATLEFCQEQLGSNYETDKNFLPKQCYLLIHKASKMGDADILDRLIECGADVNAQDDKENTALHYAVFHGHERCVWLLLDKYNCKTDICNVDKETALMRGYIKFYSQPSEQSRRAIATLLQKVDLTQVEETTRDFLDVVKSRLQKSKELVDHASVNNVAKMKELLLNYTDPNSDRDGITALEEAVCNGHKSAVKLLVKFGSSFPHNIIGKALECKHYEIARLLKASFASSKDILPLIDSIPHGFEGRNMWKGIVQCGSKLFCAPYHASSILVIDCETDDIHTIPCGVQGRYKWSGIAQYGTKLFCVPSCASSILVIDGGTYDIRSIPCGVEGDYKWSGIVQYGTKLFCAPYHASSILVIDGETEDTHTIPCGVEGCAKWAGIAQYGAKVFCAPFNATSALVIDGDTEDIHTIPSGVEGEAKWSGIAQYGRKLFCAPSNADSILVIDGETEDIHTISCGEKGYHKWTGIAQYGTKLFCAPFCTGSILMIDGETEDIHTFPCGVEGYDKWSGIAQYGTKLFCAPSNASSILLIRNCHALMEEKI